MEPKPSLIPVDVLQEVKRQEEDLSAEHLNFEGEPKTAPVPVPEGEVVLLGAGKADLEVAVFALSQVPLFRALPAASLEALAAGARQLDIPAGEVLFAEGEDASAFYVVLDGTLEVVREKSGRDVVLRQVKKDEAFGLAGLFAAQARAAGARAVGDCTVLEFTAGALQRLLEQDDALHARLHEHYRQKLGESLVAAKVFADLVDSVARAKVAARFHSVELKAGTCVLEPGEVSNLVWVVTHGRLILEERARPGQAARHLEVTPGQFLSVSSALSGLPCRLRVVAREYTTVSMLDHKDLNELFREFPALRALPARLPSIATVIDRDVCCGTVILAAL